MPRTATNEIFYEIEVTYDNRYRVRRLGATRHNAFAPPLPGEWDKQQQAIDAANADAEAQGKVARIIPAE